VSRARPRPPDLRRRQNSAARKRGTYHSGERLAARLVPAETGDAVSIAGARPLAGLREIVSDRHRVNVPPDSSAVALDEHRPRPFANEQRLRPGPLPCREGDQRRANGLFLREDDRIGRSE